ncbi:alkaline phytoceramidase [Penicillium coprophilum]|uniref:alkaline phytoceramidase n=1 Tax=Penicillium coprophilum TaxID=36646 RepID=UPI0023897BC4|nr:alkaline phytoceramidase [Penicillium coprophilum]KAJ5153994.1 alkaline phytoceramidase [Penicillium coprophilum]
MDLAKNPFWGPQTSYLKWDWLFKDYVITRYVAEFINTLSSLVYIVLGIHGLLRIIKNGQATVGRSLPFFGLMGVGVCSAGYHMTLKYQTQMSDELSMHLLTTPLVHRVLTFQKSKQYTRLMGTILSIVFTCVMVAHMVLDEFLLHAVTFGSSVLLIVICTTRLISRQIPNVVVRKNVRNVTRFGVFSFIFGYMIWLVDEFTCRYLISIRHSIGLPLAFLFEFHGWWHVFTAIGGYIAVVVIDMLTAGEVHEDPTGQFVWPLPLVARTMGSTVSKKGD